MVQIRPASLHPGGPRTWRASGLVLATFALLLGFATSSEATDGAATTVAGESASAPVESLPAVPGAPPVGHLDATSITPRGITVSGWALDPNTVNPIAVHAYLDGAGRAFTANLPRPDVDRAFGLGANHGFTLTLTATAGTHALCLYAINVPAGNNPAIWCGTIRNGVVEIAAQYVGAPYLWGGSTPAGFDCSGFTSYVYARLGVHLPRTSELQHYAGTVVARAQALPGDLIWSPGHVAIFAGGNQQIDASTSRGVQFRAIWQASPVFIRVG